MGSGVVPPVPIRSAGAIIRHHEAPTFHTTCESDAQRGNGDAVHETDTADRDALRNARPERPPESGISHKHTDGPNHLCRPDRIRAGDHGHTRFVVLRHHHRHPPRDGECEDARPSSRSRQHRR